MHALCQDDFGPDARMCTSKEFWQSPNADKPAEDAWLHSDRQGENIDFTGLGNRNANCDAWNTNVGGTGIVVTTDGRVAQPSCTVARPVTCCAPIQ